MIHEKVQQFYKFCTRMPSNKTYEYSSTRFCALGEFNNYNRDGWYDEFCRCDQVAAVEPHTYVALTKRLRAEFGID